MINEAMANGGKRHGLGSGGDGGRRLHAASIISFDPTACFRTVKVVVVVVIVVVVVVWGGLL